MNTITDRLKVLDNRIFVKGENLEVHSEGEWSNSISNYQAFNDAGVECEVGEFFYSMVRVLKPEHILETGTHWGISASYMGMALKDNGLGHLDTYEFLPEIHGVASRRIERLELQGQVTAHLQAVETVEPSKQYRLMFLDTEPQTRFNELIRFIDYLEQGGYVFIHDLHRHMHQIENADHGFAWPYGKLPHSIIDMVKRDKLRPFHFPTPRGLTGFYKTSEQDYKWL